jgi:hypothetical protein
LNKCCEIQKSYLEQNETYFVSVLNMGSGNAKPQSSASSYVFGFEKASVGAKLLEITRIKKPPLKKHDSAPNLITSTTLFCPYVDVQVGKEGESGSKIQRNVTRDMNTKLGGGKLDYRFSDYYQFSKSLPWLLKNAYFAEPSFKDFQVTRTIGDAFSDGCENIF